MPYMHSCSSLLLLQQHIHYPLVQAEVVDSPLSITARKKMKSTLPEVKPESYYLKLSLQGCGLHFGAYFKPENLVLTVLTIFLKEISTPFASATLHNAQPDEGPYRT